MRKIQLVKDLEYNKKYKERNGVKDYDNYTFFIENREKTLYEAEEIVTLSDVNKTIIDNVVNEYSKLFLKWSIEPTEAQLEFARTTVKVLLGELKNDQTIPVIPAPCGFGKSTITYVFIKEICKAIKEGLIQPGMIIVTDKLEELKKIQMELTEEIGHYKVEIINGKEYTTPFTYVLEGWTDKSLSEGICLNKKVKTYKAGMCSNVCAFFTDCKMSKQRKEQQFSPILLMTNARLETFGESVNQYGYYIDENGMSQSRTMIINDEKPVMIDSMSVSIPLVNNIENDIYHIPIANESDQKEKDKLLAKWNKVRTILKDKLNHYSSKYERFLVSNINNEPILLNDEEFINLWDKYMGNKYKNELRHIHSVLVRGGLFCNTKKQGIFINTIFMKDLINENFKTVIFDATALVDPDYSNSIGSAYEDIIRFINIENIRTFENVTFNFYQSHKINKSQFRSKNYLTSACVRFVESMPKNNQTYIVTYNEVASNMLKQLKERNNVLVKKSSKDELWGHTNKIEIVTFDDDTLFYFGNTKGSNKAKDCMQMVQFGWNTLPDYVYATKYLCTDFNEERMNTIFQKCSNIEVAENFSKYLTHGENYKFNNHHLYLYQNYSMLTDYIQEVFRTKLRNYNFDKPVEINCFQVDEVLIGMVKQLFPKCKTNIIYDKLSYFEEEKVVSRKNGDKATILKEFIDNWEDGKELTTKDICQSTGLTTNDIDNLKRKNRYFKELFDKYKVKRGRFKKVS